MMRATEVIGTFDAAGRRAAAKALGAAGPDAEQLRTAMRAPELVARMRRLCTTRLMREDLALLCANPFDVVAADEIVDAAAFVRSGMIARRDDGFHVNIDMALTMTPDMPLEFGFAATLIARLSPADLNVLARAMEVGPRPTRVEYVMELAAACADPAKVMRHIARLRDKDRDGIVTALTRGDLPDDTGQISDEIGPPMVSLEAGEAGQRGLLFRVAQPDVGVDARPVVILELAESMAELLGRVPPAPDTIEAPPKRRRQTTYTRPAPIVITEDFEHDPAPTGPPPAQGRGGVRRTQDMSNPFLRAQDPAPGVRSATAVPASAVVDLEDPRYAEAALRDKELAESILDVIAENLVVLKAGVDAAEWVERCAVRLGFH